MARQFDPASSQYLQGNTPVTAAPLTMAAWFNTSVSANQGVMSIDGSGYFYMRSRSDGYIRYYTNSAFAETTGTFTTGVWNHAVCVSAATNSRAVYINGGGKGTNTTDVTPTGIDRVYIARYAGEEIINGAIAEVGIWNVALTDAEVAVLALGVSPLLVRPASLVAYWPLIRDEDQDRVGGYHLTAYNSPTVATHPPKIRPWWARPVLFKAAAAAADLNINIASDVAAYRLAGVRIVG